MKKGFKIILGLGILLLTVIFIANYSIKSNSEGKIYTDVNLIPKHKVGLLLGTSKTLTNGSPNWYYVYRVNAAVQLFKAGKIDFILISGDNGSKIYDEPTDFKNDLIERGIPEDRIILDYAGFRTLDSVIRAKEIFGQDSITIISQEFHNERAIYLSEKNGIKAVGFNAKGISGRYGYKVMLREYLARTKVFIDILFNVQPKFLGKKVEIK